MRRNYEGVAIPGAAKRVDIRKIGNAWDCGNPRHAGQHTKKRAALACLWNRVKAVQQTYVRQALSGGKI